MYLCVFCSDESRNVLVEKFEYKRNVVGKDKVLIYEFKLKIKMKKMLRLFSGW